MSNVHYAVAIGDYLSLDLAEATLEYLTEHGIGANLITNVTTVGALYYQIHLRTFITEELAQDFITLNKEKIRMPNVCIKKIQGGESWIF